jgi:hypothetical protein
MSMDMGSKGSLKADINVTPLVDVMTEGALKTSEQPER